VAAASDTFLYLAACHFFFYYRRHKELAAEKTAARRPSGVYFRCGSRSNTATTYTQQQQHTQQQHAQQQHRQWQQQSYPFFTPFLCALPQLARSFFEGGAGAAGENESRVPENQPSMMVFLPPAPESPDLLNFFYAIFVGLSL